MPRHIILKRVNGRSGVTVMTLLMAVCLLFSCKQRGQQVQMDESAFVFETENIKGNEADYYSVLIQGLLGYKNVQKEDVSPFFRVKEAEPLFSEDCMSGNLFELSSNMATWIFSSLDRKAVLQLANDYPAQIRYLEKATKNDMLRQMLLTHFYNQLLDANEVEHFEEYFSNFNENVTYPLLKLSTRDRYVLKKAWQENPRALSNAILNADKPRDGQALTIKENEGLKPRIQVRNATLDIRRVKQ